METKIKLELKQETNLKDEIFYVIYKNGKHIHSFSREKDARKLFNELKNGKEKKEIILDTFEY